MDSMLQVKAVQSSCYFQCLAMHTIRYQEVHLEHSERIASKPQSLMDIVASRVLQASCGCCPQGIHIEPINSLLCCSKPERGDSASSSSSDAEKAAAAVLADRHQ